MGKEISVVMGLAISSIRVNKVSKEDDGFDRLKLKSRYKFCIGWIMSSSQVNFIIYVILILYHNKCTYKLFAHNIRLVHERCFNCQCCQLLTLANVNWSVFFYC